MANNPVMHVDQDGRFVWFVPVIIGAVVGGTTGGSIVHNNGQDWWKGAITGAFIGAAVLIGIAGIGKKACVSSTLAMYNLRIQQTTIIQLNHY